MVSPSASRKPHRFYLLSPEEALQALSSHRLGLSNGEAAARRAAYGPNLLREGKKVARWHKFLRQFTDVLVIILLLAAAVTALLEPREIDWVVIAAIVLINAVIGYLQEEKAEEAIARLKRLQSPRAAVIRAGERMDISASELVPGDILHVEGGMRVPADARILTAHALKVNEAPLTGESLPAEKDPGTLSGEAPLAERDNMLFMSTTVEAGRALALVTGTGMNTEIGKIADMIRQVERVETPLQKRLKKLGKHLGILVLAICGLMLLLEVWREIGDLSYETAAELFETAVSLAVAAIPEGLPAVVTIALAIGLKTMARRHVIIRKLPVVETLGSATVICTDKTGTLTTGTMTADVLLTGDERIEVSGTGYAPVGALIKDREEVHPRDLSPAARHILEASVLCSDAVLRQTDGEWHVLGDTTEGAVVAMAEKAGISAGQTREAHPRRDERPFDSKRKMMSTLHESPAGPLAYTKGAPESVLEVSSLEMKNTEAIPLSPERKASLLTLTESMAAEGYRTLGFSVSPSGAMEKDMVFLGIAGIRDKVREEATEAVRVAKNAGIRVVMITGDHKLTASAVAKQTGLITHDDETLNCRDLEDMSSEDLKGILTGTSVFARAAPEHKVMIVQALKDMGEIVAMTGDGVNDAPSLRMADIGVAMGITGTDVSKEASDMIITDDNFASIVSAVEEGRAIYDNIRKVIQFLLSCNMGEVCVMLAAVVLGWPLPLVALQILWMNLVTDSFPALALVTEPKEPDIMLRAPRDPRESAITKDMIVSVLVSAGMITAGTLAVFWYNLFCLERSLDLARTLSLTTMVLFQMWTAVASRSTTHTLAEIGWFSNKRLLLAIAVSVILMLPVIYLPILQNAFGTTALGWIEWAEITVVSVFGLFALEMWEHVNRKYLHYGAAA